MQIATKIQALNGKQWQQYVTRNEPLHWYCYKDKSTKR